MSALTMGHAIVGNACHATSRPNIDIAGLPVTARSASAKRSGNTPPMAEPPSRGGTGSMCEDEEQDIEHQEDTQQVAGAAQHRVAVGRLDHVMGVDALRGHEHARDHAEPEPPERGHGDEDVAGGTPGGPALGAAWG